MYCRKSTDTEDRQVQSIEDQKRELGPLVKQYNLNVVKTFGESQSAKTPGRKMFDEMMELVEKGQADGILCWKVNRLARNPIDGGKVQWLLQQGVIKSILTPAKEYLPTDNVLMMAVELGMANQFSIDLSNDVKRGMKTKVQKGWRPMRAPIGYLPDRAGLKGEKQVLVDPDRFEIVQKIWKTFLTGNYSVKEVWKLANDDWGLRTRGTLKESSSKLSLGGIYGMLSNPFYTGSFMYNGELLPGKHKPMVTTEEFERVQRLLGRKGLKRPKYKNLPFTGLIVCGGCGGMIVADEKFKYIKTTGETKQFLYHRCSRRKTGIACKQQPITYSGMVEQIMEYLDSITIPEEFLHWAIEVLRENNVLEEETRTKVLAVQQKNYNDCLKRVDNLINLFVSPANSGRELLTEEEYKAQKLALMGEKSRLEEELRKVWQGVDQWLELTEKTFNFATYAKYWFDKGSYEEKTNILRALGKNFTFMDGKLHIDMQKPYLTLKQGLEDEVLQKARLEPSIYALDKRKNTPLESVFSRWSSLVMDVRTVVAQLV